MLPPPLPIWPLLTHCSCHRHHPAAAVTTVLLPPCCHCHNPNAAKLLPQSCSQPPRCCRAAFAATALPLLLTLRCRKATAAAA
jgi:hypothetical protein